MTAFYVALCLVVLCLLLFLQVVGNAIGACLHAVFAAVRRTLYLALLVATWPFRLVLKLLRRLIPKPAPPDKQVDHVDYIDVSAEVTTDDDSS